MTSSTSPRSSASPAPTRLGDTPVLAWWTGRDEGDQRALGAGLDPPLPVPAGLPVRRLRQVHGAHVVVVGAATPGAEAAAEGDALVSADGSSVLAVLTADCAPVALGSADGVRAAVHMGWRGLCAGVADRAASSMRSLGAGRIVAGLGPTIGPCCYEFSPADLDVVSAAFGEVVRAESSRGRPALDLPAAVRRSLHAAGVELVVDLAVCTSCSEGYFSHRARRDDQRQALFVWPDGAAR